ncbi:MAG: hypothetical protein QXU75_04820 [Candidatus Methanomethylicaceae archaeon]
MACQGPLGEVRNDLAPLRNARSQGKGKSGRRYATPERKGGSEEPVAHRALAASPRRRLIKRAP